MRDYTVSVELQNCVPLCERAKGVRGDGAAAIQGVWVDKKADEFTIFVAMVAGDSFPWAENFHIPTWWQGEGKKWSGDYARNWPHGNSSDRNTGELYAAFAVLTDNMITAPHKTIAGGSMLQHFAGEPAVGVCVYPTVRFTITGYPESWNGQTGDHRIGERDQPGHVTLV